MVVRCIKSKQKKLMQGGAWLLYISIDHDNTLTGSSKLRTYSTSIILNKMTNYVYESIDSRLQ